MMKKYMRKSVFVLVLVVVLLALTVSIAAAKGDTSGGVYHTVSYGDTLYRIGRMYGVNPYAIARANNLYNPNYIYAGQVLYIPQGYGYPPDQSPCGNQGNVYHKVRYGETLSSIARMYGASVWAIAQANNLYNPNYIYAGQVLYIPSGGGNCGCYQDYQDCGGGCNQGCSGYYPNQGAVPYY
jgi:LysM repeat protein